MSSYVTDGDEPAKALETKKTSGEQPGMRTQRPRITNSQGLEPNNSAFSAFGVSGGFWVSVDKQPGWEPKHPEAIAPVAILPSPTGYCLRVAGAMEC